MGLFTRTKKRRISSDRRTYIRSFERKNRSYSFHKEESVNQLHFDTISQKYKKSLKLGLPTTLTIYIEWSGPLRGYIEEPMLIVQQNKNGHKEVQKFNFPSFSFDTNLTHILLQKLCQTTDLPLVIIEKLKILRPSFCYSFCRRRYVHTSHKKSIALDFNRVEIEMSSYNYTLFHKKKIAGIHLVEL